MELKEGMYVRTEKNIFKIQKINDEFITIMNTQHVLHHSKFTGHYYFCDNDEVYTIGKTSYNIIDLIEVGDYVNGHLVLDVFWNVEEDYVVSIEDAMYDLTRILYNNDIKSIVTKEQFSKTEYKVGDDI